MRWLLAILALGAILRFHGLDDLSLWNDELFSRYYPRTGLAFLWGPGWRLEPTPPLYYSLLAGWTAVFGDGPTALRGFSAAASLPGIPLAYLAARRLFASPQAGLLAALCLAILPTNVFYAQEARAYALEGTALAAALLGLVGVLQQPGRLAWPVLFAAGALLGVYCHPTAALFAVAANLVVLATLLLPGRPLPRRALVQWCAANLVLALACIPLLRAILAPSVGAAVRWMEPLAPGDVAYAFATLVAGPAVSNVSGPAALAGLLVLAAILAPLRPSRVQASVAALPVLAFALMVLASAVQPMLMLRTVAWLAVPLAVLLGGALARHRWPGRLAALGLVAALLAVQMHAAASLKEDWRGQLAALAPRLRGTVVVLAPSMPPTALDTYAPGLQPLDQLPGSGPGTVESTVIPALLHVRPITWSAFADAIRAGRPVWLLGRGEPDAELDAHLAQLPPPARSIPGPPGFALAWNPAAP